MVKKSSSPSSSAAARSKSKTDKPVRKAVAESPAEGCCQGAPIEHYRGEPHVGPGPHCTGDPGSLEEETLDENAPYNKTYGHQNQ